MDKILIVDDEPGFQSVLAMYLESQGYQVECATSGKEALEIFERVAPDLVISDVIMPVMDGFEFCRHLRSTRSGQLVPFIFLSSQGELESRVEGYTRGGDDYLIKPFDAVEILAKVKAMLERNHRIHAEMIRLVQRSSEQELLLETTPATPVPKPLPLSRAEERVFWEVIQGYTNKQISEHLYLSPRTVQAHLNSIYSKLEIKNRSQLIRFALEGGYRATVK
ncbi:MAG: response regulator transcription factor [Actinomycetota bacterium]